MDALANNILRLRNWAPTIDPVTGVVSANYLVEPDSCPKCGAVDRLYRHGVKVKTIRDTPTEGRVSWQAHIQRYRCRECGGSSMQPTPDLDPRHRMTVRCADWVGRRCRERTFTELAYDIGVDEKTIRNICFVRFGRSLHERRVTVPIMLGIDEVYIRFKGMGGSKRKCSVFSDLLRTQGFVDIIDSGNVNGWLAKLPNKQDVALVAMDMAEPYRLAVRAILPHAKIVVDKFHVEKKVNEALDAVRGDARRQQLQLTGRRFKTKHRDRNLLQISRHKLSLRWQFKLDGVLKNNPMLDAAWQAKESFYDIWDTKDRQEAERRFAAWKNNIPPLAEVRFRPIAQMVDRWHEEIFFYFNCGITNAYTEALNRLVKDMNRDGRGYSFRNIRAKALLRDRRPPKFECTSCGRNLPLKSIAEAKLHHNHGEPIFDPITGRCTEVICKRCRRNEQHSNTGGLLNGHGVSP